MTIHVVAAGDTINSIAQRYGVTPERIILINELPNPQNLLIGQSLAIRKPEVTHTVVEGDTIEQLATRYNVTTTKILQNNPQVAATNSLTVGQTVVISYEGESPIDSIIVNGYAYPFIDRTVLRKSLPFLTYLSIFTYGFTPAGDLIPVDDSELIAIAKEYGVVPVMMLAPMTEAGEFNSDIAHNMFVNEEGENRLIENIVANMKAKGYQAMDIDFEFIKPEDKGEFLSFITKTQDRLSQEGFRTFVALAPKTSGTMTGVLYEAHDYPTIGAEADDVLLMTYEWGYMMSPPMATAPLLSVRRVLVYGTSVIDPSKILMGIPNYAYDWALPYVRGETRAESLGNQEAIARAAQYNTTILFDEANMVPYFFYTTAEGIRHVVWFDDVRSMDAKFRLIPELGLDGAGIWQIMKYFPGLYNVIGALFTVEKL
ncbi:MAG TPA: LysM peptidoglycan-binding domain-containing protein [Lachnospiraceae bacterium]|nr:LysM peptidoglycan-binding domain-containing protein [Lachnospiraceae bacterium]